MLDERRRLLNLLYARAMRAFADEYLDMAIEHENRLLQGGIVAHIISERAFQMSVSAERQAYYAERALMSFGDEA